MKTPATASLLLPCALLLCLVTPALHAGEFKVANQGPVTADEQAFVRYVIFELKDLELTRRWIPARLKTARDLDSRAFLEYSLADTIRVGGDFDGFVKRTGELAKKYRTYHRSQGARLDAIRAKMATVLQLSLDSRLEKVLSRRAEILRDRERVFRTDVVSALDTRIQALNTQIEAAQEPGVDELRQRLTWEHYRIKAWMLYARDFNEGS